MSKLINVSNAKELMLQLLGRYFPNTKTLSLKLMLRDIDLLNFGVTYGPKLTMSSEEAMEFNILNNKDSDKVTIGVLLYDIDHQETTVYVLIRRLYTGLVAEIVVSSKHQPAEA